MTMKKITYIFILWVFVPFLAKSQYYDYSTPVITADRSAEGTRRVRTISEAGRRIIMITNAHIGGHYVYNYRESHRGIYQTKMVDLPRSEVQPCQDGRAEIPIGMIWKRGNWDFVRLMWVSAQGSNFYHSVRAYWNMEGRSAFQPPAAGSFLNYINTPSRNFCDYFSYNFHPVNTSHGFGLADVDYISLENCILPYNDGKPSNANHNGIPNDLPFTYHLKDGRVETHKDAWINGYTDKIIWKSERDVPIYYGTVDGSVELDAGEGEAYLWSNGETSRKITVTEEGYYAVTVSRKVPQFNGTEALMPVSSFPVYVSLSRVTTNPSQTVSASCSFTDNIPTPTITAPMQPVKYKEAKILTRAGQQIFMGIRGSLHQDPQYGYRCSTWQGSTNDYTGTHTSIIHVDKYTGFPNGEPSGPNCQYVPELKNQNRIPLGIGWQWASDAEWCRLLWAQTPGNYSFYHMCPPNEYLTLGQFHECKNHVYRLYLVPENSTDIRVSDIAYIDTRNTIMFPGDQHYEEDGAPQGLPLIYHLKNGQQVPRQAYVGIYTGNGDTKYVTWKQKINIPVYRICKEDTPFHLTAPSGYARYEWSHGEIGEQVSITDSGFYQVRIFDENGCWVDSNPVQVIIDEECALVHWPFDRCDTLKAYEVIDDNDGEVIGGVRKHGYTSGGMMWDGCGAYMKAELRPKSVLRDHFDEFSLLFDFRVGEDLRDEEDAQVYRTTEQTILRKEGAYQARLVPKRYNVGTDAVRTAYDLVVGIHLAGQEQELIIPELVTTEEEYDRWHRIALTYDGTVLKLYERHLVLQPGGQRLTETGWSLKASKSALGKVGTTGKEGTPVYMASADGTTSFARIILDEVKMYKEALDDTRLSSYHVNPPFRPEKCADYFPNVVHDKCGYIESGKVELITKGGGVYEWEIEEEHIKDDDKKVHSLHQGTFVTVVVTDDDEKFPASWQIQQPIEWHLNDSISWGDPYTKLKYKLEEPPNHKHYLNSDHNHCDNYCKKQSYTKRILSNESNTWIHNLTSSRNLLTGETPAQISFIVGESPEDDEYVFGFSTVNRSFTQSKKPPSTPLIESPHPLGAYTFVIDKGNIRIYEYDKRKPFCDFGRVFPGDYLRIERTAKGYGYYKNNKLLVFTSITEICPPDYRVMVAIKKGEIHSASASFLPSPYIYQYEAMGGIPKVLTTSAVTFASSFPSDTFNPIIHNSYLATQQANIWRNEATYAFVTARSYSELPNLAQDGTFPAIHFNYLNPAANAFNWHKVNTVTRYNTYNYETENRDVAGHYSSALYGFNGQLSIAVAANAPLHEVGFEDFEQYKSGIPQAGLENNLDFYVPQTINTEVKHSIPLYGGRTRPDAAFALGNWVGFLNVGEKVNLNAGEKYYLQVLITGVEFQYERGHTLICFEDFSKVEQFQNKTVPLESWEGSIQKTIFVTSNQQTPTLTENFAHTGKRALQGGGAFVHQRLQVQSNKRYVVSAWVYGNGRIIIPNAKNEGSYRNEFGTMGQSIEGWRRIEGVFEIKEGNKLSPLQMSLQGAYWDDIRVYPASGNIQTYVYDPYTYRLRAVLDQNNYATLYYYDEAGNLYLTKKETAQGVQTIQTVIGNQKH